MSLASWLSGNGDPHTGQTLVGVGLVIASQLVQTVELLVDGQINSLLTLSPLKIVGCEGLLGVMCMVRDLVCMWGAAEGYVHGAETSVSEVLVIHGAQCALPLLLKLWGVRGCWACCAWERSRVCELVFCVAGAGDAAHAAQGCC